MQRVAQVKPQRCKSMGIIIAPRMSNQATKRQPLDRLRGQILENAVALDKRGQDLALNYLQAQNAVPRNRTSEPASSGSRRSGDGGYIKTERCRTPAVRGKFIYQPGPTVLPGFPTKPFLGITSSRGGGGWRGQDQDQDGDMMQSTLRVSLPLRIQQLWDCFTGHGPTLDIDKFASLAASLHKIPKDTLTDDLENAVKDGLILAEMIQDKGDEVEIYKLPEFPIEKGDHDWYCFRCHLGGPIVKCEDCPRVFHLECLPEDRKPHKDLFICPPCHMLSTKSNTEKMGLKTKQLNTLITYILDRFREWKIDELDRAEAKVWVTRVGRPAKETWRFDSLVYTPMDLNAMYEKATNSNYKSIEEFQVDCETLYHGIATFFGIEATKGGNIGASFHRDITHEINEVMLCHDCFRLSNEKNHPWWFCLPCTTPHEVVFAKQTGYPFWPAKVMKKEGNKYDVRYFGGNYERAIIDAKNIMPIDTPVSQLKIRKNATWNEAFDELQKFQDIARNPDLVNSLPASKGRSATPAAKSPKANAVKRPASEPAKVTTSKKAKVVESANSTPARGRASTSTTSTNGMPDARKKIIRNNTPSTPKPALTRRENNTPASSSATPVVATKRADSTGSGDKFLVPETIEEIQSTIDSFFKSSRDGASNADVNYSDDEDDKMSDDKASEDAVSSSVNESGSNRSAYVQTNTEFIIPKEAKNKIQNFILAMKDSYYQEISANKKKQWCFNCEREAIYHCCWNTAYCSTECQQQHWTKEHKKQCRHRRQQQQ